MSTSLIAAVDTATTPATPRRPLPSWLREPLLHFIVLGAALFAADHGLLVRDGDPRTIVVAASVDAEAIKLFRESRDGRAPKPDELAALRRRWLDNEVLYREGLALRVDQGDPTIRDRVIFKALMTVETGLRLPEIDDAALRRWFESRRAQYDDPARYDFQEAVLAGDASEAAVRAFVAALNAGTPGDAKAGLRVFKARPHDNLVQGYGAEFAQALPAARVGEWNALRSKDGYRAVRLDVATPARPASYEALRGVVRQDWTDATMAQLRSDAVGILTKKYRVVTEGARP